MIRKRAVGFLIAMSLVSSTTKPLVPLAIAIPPATAVVQGTVASLAIPVGVGVTLVGALAGTAVGIASAPAAIIASPFLFLAYLALSETKKAEDNKSTQSSNS